MLADETFCVWMKFIKPSPINTNQDQSWYKVDETKHAVYE